MDILKQTRFFLSALLLLAGPALAAPKLPDNLEWLTNDEDPVFASPEAKKGGTLYLFELSFPLTLRTVGPDSNGSFRPMILDNQMSLVTLHPNTRKLLPSLATHWAYGDDNKTMYFKLNPKARWSDGKPVTAEDFAFTLEFMRSKHIIAPWYNTFYGKELDKVTIYDPLTISVSSAKPRPRDELYAYLGISPTPKHFYKSTENLKGFVQKYNWKIVPNTGPYQIDKIKKGKSITFKRKKDWWAKDLKYFRNRYNVDKVKVTVIRDMNLAWENFRKGKLDAFGITAPSFWHEKAKGKLFDKGYIHKLWFYEDTPQPTFGIWLNQDKPWLGDLNVRLGIAHAFNIDKVNRQVLRNDYVRKNTISSGFGPYTNTEIRARPFDLDKADEYFNKAGFSKRGPDGIRVNDKGDRLSFSVTYGNDLHTPRLVVIKEEFKRAGLELKLRKLDSASSFKSVREKKHDIWWGALVGGLRPQYWGQFHSVNAHKPQTNNFTNTDDPEMDRLIDAYRSALTVEERTTLAKQIQQLIHDQSAWIPRLDVPFVRMAYWRWLKMPETPATRLGGLVIEGPFDEMTGGLFWIDKDEKKATLKAKKKGKAYEPVTRIDTTYKVAE